MTPKEKILRDAIIFEMASIALKRHRLRQGSIEKTILDESHARLFTAIKQADAVKDGPSEEDKRRYEHFKSILLDQKDRLTWREAKELFGLVSRSWGIE